MLLLGKKDGTDNRRILGLGQLCLFFGLLMSHFGGSHGYSPWELLGISTTDFLEGFLLGVGIVLVLASIPLNIVGMKRSREQQDRT